MALSTLLRLFFHGSALLQLELEIFISLWFLTRTFPQRHEEYLSFPPFALASGSPGAGPQGLAGLLTVLLRTIKFKYLCHLNPHKFSKNGETSLARKRMSMHKRPRERFSFQRSDFRNAEFLHHLQQTELRRPPASTRLKNVRVLIPRCVKMERATGD